ncbi:sigma-70 family RNA polymerase sigma factor [Isobaculum melis]|uniref:RNA polymerase, sigma subunit, SigV n=1 Tax=Isobaculum melis TaxID=142588 RepID=A0A1H9PSW7_9LACT|nr:sigma-70 family RNA polymerase sigma factor [Isobaculum melis]SER51228.1 RNA polymerase, sigma subunit, SigV [Isobaculum melis]
MVQMNEQTLQMARKAQRGNVKAIEWLLKKEYEYIYYTAYRCVHSEQDALDVVQEATVRALRSVTTLKKPHYFYTWYTRILLRVAGKLLDEKNKMKQVEFKEHANQILAIDDHLKKENQIDLEAALERIEEKYREVLQLFYYQNLTIQEISRLLNIPEGTVKTNLSRGKQKLRVELGGDYYER